MDRMNGSEQGVETEKDADLHKTSQDETGSGEEIEDTSSEGSDSDEEEDQDSDEPDEDVPDLKARLATFLPQLKEANRMLDTAKRIDDVGEGEQHIEMNLGLGVLEEKREGVQHHDESTSDSEDDEEDEVSLPPPKKRNIEELG
jgi:hypothetical protein